jgi:hypothetical protein
MRQNIVKIHIVGKVDNPEMHLWLKDSAGQGKWVQVPEVGQSPYNVRIVQIIYQEKLGWLALIEYIE